MALVGVLTQRQQRGHQYSTLRRLSPRCFWQLGHWTLIHFKIIPPDLFFIILCNEFDIQLSLISRSSVFLSAFPESPIPPFLPLQTIHKQSFSLLLNHSFSLSILLLTLTMKTAISPEHSSQSNRALSYSRWNVFLCMYLGRAMGLPPFAPSRRFSFSS